MQKLLWSSKLSCSKPFITLQKTANIKLLYREKIPRAMHIILFHKKLGQILDPMSVSQNLHNPSSVQFSSVVQPAFLVAICVLLIYFAASSQFNSAPDETVKTTSTSPAERTTAAAVKTVWADVFPRRDLCTSAVDWLLQSRVTRHPVLPQHRTSATNMTQQTLIVVILLNASYSELSNKIGACSSCADTRLLRRTRPASSRVHASQSWPWASLSKSQDTLKPFAC